jgi:hypothetical protein
MDAEINSALAIFFLGLRKRSERPRNIGTHCAVISVRRSVKFIGDECKVDVIGPVKATKRLKERAAEGRMT